MSPFRWHFGRLGWTWDSTYKPGGSWVHVCWLLWWCKKPIAWRWF